MLYWSNLADTYAWVPDLSFQNISGPWWREVVSGKEMLMRNFKWTEKPEWEISQDVAIVWKVISLLDNGEAENIHVNVFPSTLMSAKFHKILQALPDDLTQLTKRFCIEILEHDGLNDVNMSMETVQRLIENIKKIQDRYGISDLEIWLDDYPVHKKWEEYEHTYFDTLLTHEDTHIHFVKLDGKYAIEDWNGSDIEQENCTQAYIDSIDYLMNKWFDGYIIVEWIEHESFYTLFTQKVEQRLQQFTQDIARHKQLIEALNRQLNDQADKKQKHVWTKNNLIQWDEKERYKALNHFHEDQMISIHRQIEVHGNTLSILERSVSVYDSIRYQWFALHLKEDFDFPQVLSFQMNQFLEAQKKPYKDMSIAHR